MTQQTETALPISALPDPAEGKPAGTKPKGRRRKSDQPTDASRLARRIHTAESIAGFVFVAPHDTAAAVGLSITTIKIGCREGWFPPPLLLSPRRLAWRSDHLRAWMGRALKSRT